MALCSAKREEVVFRLCENEGVKMGLYRRGGLMFGYVWVGWVGKWFEFEW